MRATLSIHHSYLRSTGNELSLRNKDYRAIYAIAADLINYARSYQLQKWNRNIPFTTAMLDVEGAVRAYFLTCVQ